MIQDKLQGIVEMQVCFLWMEGWLSWWSYLLSLDNLPATVSWLDRYDWKAVAMEILLKLNLCFSILAQDKEEDCWDQRRAMKEENFNEMRQSVMIFFLECTNELLRNTFSEKVSGWVVRRKWEVVYCLEKHFVTVHVSVPQRMKICGSLVERESNSVCAICTGVWTVCLRETVGWFQWVNEINGRFRRSLRFIEH